MTGKEALYEHLHSLGQQHLLQFWHELSPEQQRNLVQQIHSIDFQRLAQLFRRGPQKENFAALARRAAPPPAIRLVDKLSQRANPGARQVREVAPLTPPDYSGREIVHISREDARLAGAAALKAGQLGVVLVAGGQGTRLGFHHPKGMYPIGPVSGHSLFQILFEKVLAVGRRYGRALPIYLMTSPATRDETLRFLAENQRFGVAKDDLTIFCQGVMPAVDRHSGKVLLADKGNIALSPDGHGGLVAALAEQGLLKEMQQRGLAQLNYLQVDNPLAAACDVDFLGYHLLWGAEVSLQVVPKRTPRDRLGNVVQIDGQMRIIEYSELNHLSDEIVLRRTENGEHVFWAGSTGVHLLNVEFLCRQARSTEGLPFHWAHKKVAYVDGAGNLVQPRLPNAVKFERFIFDMLPFAADAMAMEVDARTSYAPVKNAPGESHDTPEAAQAQMMTVYREWLAAAGINLSPEKPVEISPLLALDQDQLREMSWPALPDGPVFLQ